MEFKHKVIEEYDKGRSAVALGRKYGISPKTIETWVRKVRLEGTLVPNQRGRRSNSDVNYKEKYEILKKYQAFLREVDQEKK